MTIADLQKKVELLNEALSNTENSLNDIYINLKDKKAFNELYKEAGEPKMFEPTGSISEYWFLIVLNNYKFIISYKVKAVTTYETL